MDDKDSLSPISSNSYVFFAKCFVRMRTNEENGFAMKPWFFSDMILQKTMGWCTAQCEMFCVKTIMKESQFWTSSVWRKRRRKKEKHFGRSVTFWFGTFAMLFVPLGMLLMIEDEWYLVIKAYRFTFFEIWGIFLYYHMLCVHTIPTDTVFQLYGSTHMFWPWDSLELLTLL